MAPTVVILAAGRGTRMRSATPKLAHDLCGRPLLGWPLEAARAAGAGRIVLVVGPQGPPLAQLGGGVELALQAEPRGTGDAVAAAAPQIERDSTAIVLSGDVPLVEAQLLRELAAAHEAAGAAATVVTAVLPDPRGYGRIVRDGAGAFVRIVETKVEGDATETELALREVNTGIYAFDGGALLDALPEIGAANAQGERYLTDVLELLRARGARIETLAADDPAIVMGVNDRVQLAAVRAEAQRRIHERHMLAGVTIIDPATTTIDVGVTIGEDAVIEPGSQLRGSTRVGAGATIGPHTTAIDAVLGERVSAVHSYLMGCEVGPGTSVGPFAHLHADVGATQTVSQTA